MFFFGTVVACDCFLKKLKRKWAGDKHIWGLVMSISGGYNLV